MKATEQKLTSIAAALPGPTIGGISLAVTVVAVAAGLFAQVRVGRANPAEVLRDPV